MRVSTSGSWTTLGVAGLMIKYCYSKLYEIIKSYDHLHSNEIIISFISRDLDAFYNFFFILI